MTVEVKYPCRVPLGNWIVCGGPLGSYLGSSFLWIHTLKAQASFPNQGSYYQSVWKSDIGGNGCAAAGGH